MGISAGGGVAYQRSFLARRFAHWEVGVSLLSPLPHPTCVCVCVCVYIYYLMGIYLGAEFPPRLIASLSHQVRDGWPGHIEAPRPATLVCPY